MASFVIVAAILMCFFSASSAHDFTISWVQNPKESFNAWASRMRFQVNDNLVFKYNTADDSVLMVKKEDYDACNVKNPVQKLEGPSFQLTRSGPFYFISGVEEKCSKGEKLLLVVLAERNKKPVIPKPPTSPSPSSSPSLKPPTSPSPSSSPSLKPPTQSPTPPSMAPSVSPPTSSMAPSVSSSPPASSTAPTVSSSPSSSMAPSVSSSPPSSSMAPGTYSESPAPSSINGGNEPVASPTSAENAKSSTTALTASSLTIMMGAIMILGQALLLG